MKTGLLKRGFLGVACALALLVSLPFTALADDGSQPAGNAEYTFELTGYEYGARVTGVKAVFKGLNCFAGIYEDEDGTTSTGDNRFNAGKSYYLLVNFPCDPFFSGKKDVALTFNGQSYEAEKATASTRDAYATAVFKLPELEVVPFLIPFTKIVEQTGDVAPGTGNFELEVANVYKETNLPVGQFDVDGSFSTEGAGSAEKCLSIGNDDFDKVLGLLSEGILVSERNLGVEGWTYDDAVWYVELRMPEVNSLADDSQGMPSAFEDYLKYLVFYKVKMIGGELAPDSDYPADKMVFTNSYNESDPVISLTLPFVKKVAQGGALAPGKETFELEIFGVGTDEEGYADVTYTAAVETNGKGDFEGELTITGPASQVESFICEGFFVREVKGAAKNWTYSDAVWFVNREWVESEEITFTPTFGDAMSNGNPNVEAEPQMALVVYPTTREVDEQGEKYYIPAEESVEKMVFENVYTAAEPAALAQTGDGANAVLLTVLLLVSGVGVAGAAYGARRKLAE